MSVSGVAQQLDEVVEALFERQNEPWPRPRVSAVEKARATALAQRMVDEVTPELMRVLPHAGEDEGARLRLVGTWAAVGVASLAVAMGEDALATRALNGMERAVAGDAVLVGILSAGARSPAELRALGQARWLRARGKLGRSRQVLSWLVASGQEPALREPAQALLDAPVPIKSAPTLFTLNGIGTRLNGKRDTRDDGSYVSTLCFTVLFVPLVPIAAYRVTDAGAHGYHFHGKVPLSRFAEAVRVVAMLAVVALVASAGVDAYRRSAWHQVGRAVAEGRALEQAGQLDAAHERYSAAIDAVGSGAGIAPVVEALVRLMIARVPAPLGVGDLDRVERLLSRYETLPSDGRGAAPALLSAACLRWVSELDAAQLAAAEGQVRLLAAATRLLPGDGALAARYTDARLAVAERLAAEWPLEAIAHLLEVGPAMIPRAVELAGPLLVHPPLLEDEPGVFAALEKALASAPEYAELARHLTAARGQLAAATADEGRARALEGDDEAALEALLRERPWDQAVALTLTVRRAARGATGGPEALLARYGKLGHLTRSARLWMAHAALGAGDLEAADANLERYVGARLPVFRRAREVFRDALDEAERRYVEKANGRTLPSDLQDRLGDARQAEQRPIFEAWLREKVGADPAVVAARDAYGAAQDVVAASVMLGTVKLRRAQREEDAARAALLGDAERSFLAIEGAAEGDARFQLGLGEVYHRTGRPEKGDAALAVLLARDDPQLHLEVAVTYRELGLRTKAREVAEAVYTAGDEAVKKSAAVMMALLSVPLDERKQWYERADTKLLAVRASLLEIAAEELMRTGQSAAADAKAAQAVALWAPGANHDPVSANNAAVALLRRYEYTGDVAHVRRAVELLERSLRGSPASTVVMGNLAETLTLAAQLAALEKHVHLRALAPHEAEADYLVGELVEGGQGDAILSALRASPANQRALALYAQQEAMSPSAVAPYRAAHAWALLGRDGPALTGLSARLQRVQKLDTATQRISFERWVTGVDDDRVREAVDEALRRIDRAMPAIQKEGHAPTIACAHLLRSLALSRRGLLEGSEDDLRAAIAADRAARAAWPEGLRERWDNTSLYLALLEEAHRDDAGRAWWPTAWHRHPSVETLLASLEKEQPAIRERLRARPELRAAARAISGELEHVSPLVAWVVAAEAGDAALRARVEAALRQPETRARLEVEQRLAPWTEEATMIEQVLAVVRAP